jgi:hypothetical protein
MAEKPTETEILNQTRLLALDEEPLMLETYRRLFQGRAETVNSIAAGMSRLKKDENLRIVIVDFRMRDGGLAFLANMKRRFPDRLVIVLHPDENGLRGQERDLGCFRVLQKSSVRFDLLEDAIKEAISLLRLRARTSTT